jgi:protein involved in polysaccharide export with SLBB domain
MGTVNWCKRVLAPLALGFATCLLWGADEPPDPKKVAEPNRVEPGDDPKAMPTPPTPFDFLPPEGFVVLDPPDEDAIKPLPLVPIPDPPPHEGALFDLPYVVEPPDMLVVEVLEALPDRPVTGERLVRPDGMISLSFYGDLYVRGLTLEQVKVKIIERMRKYLDDEVLGLIEINPLSNMQAAVPPRDSVRVFTEVTRYSSKNYYVQGAVASPGRMPWMGTDTVLDAIQYAGGLLSNADTRQIRLIRPARGGAPTRTYYIDLRGIVDRAEKALNYQLFPGDRLVVDWRSSIQRTSWEGRPASEPLLLAPTIRTTSWVENRTVSPSLRCID